MKAKVEQADGRGGRNRRGNYHKYLKRRQHRLWRRWAKLDPEDAPRKFKYWGYET